MAAVPLGEESTRLDRWRGFNVRRLRSEILQKNNHHPQLPLVTGPSHNTSSLAGGRGGNRLLGYFHVFLERSRRSWSTYTGRPSALASGTRKLPFLG